jgi:flagellar basal-body rod modification protein FlgD
MTAIDPFASVRLGAQTNTATAKSPDDQFGTDTFLKLLVAQLQYQDPMQPQDSTQFLTQTAQFTMVEKLTSLDTQTKSALQANQLLASSSMIGHEVKYKDANGDDQTGVVSSVKVTSDGPQLVVGSSTVPYSMIEEVHQVSAPPTSSSTTSS